LGNRAGAVLRAERSQGRGAVEAAQVIALAAAAVIEDGVAAVGVADRGQPRRDLGDRRVPVDLLEGPIRAFAQRVEDPLAAAVLVMVEAERLLAGVALGGGMRLVPADLLEPAAGLAPEPDQNPAVTLAQDAGGGLQGGGAIGLPVRAHRDISSPKRAPGVAPV